MVTGLPIGNVYHLTKLVLKTRGLTGGGLTPKAKPSKSVSTGLLRKFVTKDSQESSMWPIALMEGEGLGRRHASPVSINQLLLSCISTPALFLKLFLFIDTGVNYTSNIVLKGLF